VPAVDELYSLLVPLAATRLILPRACVAEVVSFTPELRVTDDAAPWLLGSLEWNGREIPVISFEGACGLEFSLPTGRVRAVVVRCLGTQLEAGHFALVTQGFPQLVRVNSAVLEPDPSSGWSDRSPVICQLRMINQRPVIPDLEQLEHMIAERLAA
jgi:chemosensory pili system protein ChpC